MWPFRRKPKEIPPPPMPESWDWDSALGERLMLFLHEYSAAFEKSARMADGELTVSFEKVGSVKVALSPAPDGGFNCQWGPWMPYDAHAGRRSYDAPVYDESGSTCLVIATSRVEQERRGLLVSLDDIGNTALVWPTTSLAQRPNQSG